MYVGLRMRVLHPNPWTSNLLKPMTEKVWWFVLFTMYLVEENTDGKINNLHPI